MACRVWLFFKGGTQRSPRALQDWQFASRFCRSHQRALGSVLGRWEFGEVGGKVAGDVVSLLSLRSKQLGVEGRVLECSVISAPDHSLYSECPFEQTNKQ